MAQRNSLNMTPSEMFSRAQRLRGEARQQTQQLSKSRSNLQLNAAEDFDPQLLSRQFEMNHGLSPDRSQELLKHLS